MDSNAEFSILHRKVSNLHWKSFPRLEWEAEVEALAFFEERAEVSLVQGLYSSYPTVPEKTLITIISYLCILSHYQI